METDPLQVHRSIWYTFRFHIDQAMSRAYLLHFDPTTLHETDTLAYSWKTSMPFMTRMDIDDQLDWIPVTRPPSPPVCKDAPDTFTMTQSLRNPGKQKHPKKSQTHISWSQGLPPVTTVDDHKEHRPTKTRHLRVPRPHRPVNFLHIKTFQQMMAPIMRMLGGIRLLRISVCMNKKRRS